MVKENFVPYAPCWGDSGYAKETEWFENVFGGNNGAEWHIWGTHWMLATASGTKAKMKDPEHVTFEEALEGFRKLPDSERKPAEIEDRGPFDPTRYACYTEAPPPGGLALDVYCRPLGRDAQGGLCLPKHFGPPELHNNAYPLGHVEPQGDWVWLTRSEWQSLIPAQAKKGQTFAVPAPIFGRIVFCYLINPIARPVCGGWDSAKNLKSGSLTAAVEHISSASMRLVLQGDVSLVSMLQGPSEDNKNEVREQGYDAKLYGVLEYDVPKKVVTRFRLVALGDYWGFWATGYSSRPLPVGYSFELNQRDYQVPAERRRRIPWPLESAKRSGKELELYWNISR